MQSLVPSLKDYKERGAEDSRRTIFHFLAVMTEENTELCVVKGWSLKIHRMVVFLLTVFVLSLLILVHEFGHFLAAQFLKIRVLTFSLGFGPKLFRRVRGETEFAFSVIPLGGYVKMAGDEPKGEGSSYEPY